jgi:hypothetical protein
MRLLAMPELNFVAGGPPENPPADKGPEPTSPTSPQPEENTDWASELADYIKTWALFN